MWLPRIWPLVCVVIAAFPARADEVQIAVAANFAGPMQQIGAAFTKETGHRTVVAIGATGKLYAQIENGAPFELFLAADQKTPAKLEAEGRVVPGGRFTYALGKLALWSTKPGFVDGVGSTLKKGAFRHLAIASPKLAPYGAAAIEVLAALGVLEAVRPKLVEGENIAQAAAFVSSGNAEIGLVALSQVRIPGAPTVGSYAVVPEGLHAPIRQDVVWLRNGKNNPAARAFMSYLAGTTARTLISASGYGLPQLAVTVPAATGAGVSR